MRQRVGLVPVAAAIFGGMWLHYNVFDERGLWGFLSGVVIFFVVAARLQRYVVVEAAGRGLEAEALAIIRRRASELARATGIPETQIYREMVDKELTPGEWALDHGLDPVTFRPLEG